MYAGHVNTQTYKMETVWKLLGVTVKGTDYDRRLRSALRLLESKGLISGWEISDNKLAVPPQLTPTKLNFLRRRNRQQVVIASKIVPAADVSVDAPVNPTVPSRDEGIGLSMGRALLSAFTWLVAKARRRWQKGHADRP